MLSRNTASLPNLAKLCFQLQITPLLQRDKRTTCKTSTGKCILPDPKSLLLKYQVKILYGLQFWTSVLPQPVDKVFFCIRIPNKKDTKTVFKIVYTTWILRIDTKTEKLFTLTTFPNTSDLMGRACFVSCCFFLQFISFRL